MTISANAVWEVRTTGSDNNGGGFVTGSGGTDRSQQDTAHATLTTSSTVHTTTTQINVAVGDYTVTSDDVGNILQITGGTATAGFYQITAADTGNNRWTLDRSAGTSTQTVAGAMGGAVASLGKLGHSTAIQAANRVWVKSGTYTLTTATANVSGGPLDANGFAAGLSIEGYQTTRGDRAARPVVSAGSVTGISNGLIRGVGSRSGTLINMEVDGNNGTGNIRGIEGGYCAYQCVVRNFSAANSQGFNISALGSKAVNCVIGFTSSSNYCFADTCTTGFSNGGTGTGNIAKSCTTGFSNNSNKWTNCIAYGCTNGFDWNASSGGTSYVMNSIAYGCSANGFRSNSQSALFTLNCAAGNNTTANFSTCFEEGSITLTADPFTDATNNDFSLNNTAGGGALLQGAGFPTSIPVV